ncbi:hypothetical protein BAY61_23155 [Prauserella marina]|uniref:Hydrogenase maturation protease n=1 Tax=Prauserella marina TaxID=530584 RepID=A0A222VU19_9PSEU|nr:hydrogenase maturation protease [Prauserella marina]ASR37419.1 hypothetical protein BAY61_23155 [Prauserella marina]PWV74701.1 hydrogenase maturation protease [Prauserella marina]SDD42944.1 hydrogenase maturation protease [Prauserella marina]
MRPRVLVAGVGNVALGDDGFGVEVVQRLEGEALPDWVQIADYGVGGAGHGRIDGDLVGGYDTTILVDATPRGRQGGSLCVLEVELGDHPDGVPALLASHGIRPEGALRLLQLLGGDAGRVLVVCCEPVKTTGVGLSREAAGAAEDALRIVTDLVWGNDPEISVTRLLTTPDDLVDPEAPRQFEPVRGQ